MEKELVKELAVVLMNVIERITAFDLKITRVLEKQRWKHGEHVYKSITDWIMIAIAKFSPVAMLSWIAGMGVYGLLNHRRSLFLAVPACVAAGFLSRLVSGWLSSLVPRERPFQQLSLRPLIIHHPSASFPSNHAAGGFALATALFQINHPAGTWYLIWAAILAYSRLYVRLHFFSDVLVGAMIGAGTGMLCGMLVHFVSW